VAQHGVTASADADRPHVGESLQDYFTRVVVNDARLLRYAEDARSLIYRSTLGRDWALPVGLSAGFSPADFDPEEVLAVHGQLARVPLRDLSERTMRLLNWAWGSGGKGAVAYLYHMGVKPPFDPSRRPKEPASNDWRVAVLARVILIYRVAARRRDLLVARFCAALRTGRIIAEGFRASDVARRIRPITTPWWSDSALLCVWRTSELRPCEGAPAGTPHFRGIALKPGKAPRRKGSGGRQSKETVRVVALMRADCASGAITWEQLEVSREKFLMGRYGCSRWVAGQARGLLLAERLRR
jgi:hypothetical protein